MNDSISGNGAPGDPLAHEPPSVPRRSRLAWCLTGSGHFLRESLALAERLQREQGIIDMYLSRAAAEVIRMYGYRLSGLKDTFHVYPDTTSSAVPVAHFYHDVYHTVVVAPATSNTVAKCALGLSDTLVTNVFAQAGKCRVPAIVFACDTAPVVETEAPRETVKLYPRAVDLAHARTLAGFDATTVVDSPDALESALRARLAEVARTGG